MEIAFLKELTGLAERQEAGTLTPTESARLAAMMEEMMEIQGLNPPLKIKTKDDDPPEEKALIPDEVYEIKPPRWQNPWGPGFAPANNCGNILSAGFIQAFNK